MEYAIAIMYSSNTQKTQSKIPFLAVSQILLYYLSSSTVTCQPNFFSRVCQDTFGNYTANSTFKRNLDTLLSTITSPNTRNDYGFYNFSVGQDMDIVNGIALCRADTSVTDCRQCLVYGAAEIVEDCPYQKDAIGWYDSCMIRYSNRYIFNKLEFGPWYRFPYTTNGVDKKRFNQTSSTLLAKLQKKAASGDSRLKFAAGQANVSSNFTLYAFVQCTPDLEYYDCYDCLDNAIYVALTELNSSRVRVSYTSCNIRTDDYQFYNAANLMLLKPSQSSASSSPPSSASVSTQGRGRKKSRVLIIVLLPVITTLLLLVALSGCCFLRRRTKARKSVETGAEIIRNPESLQMDFDTIKVATGNFSNANKLGRGGFGTVYKGRLPTGEAIAAKRLFNDAGQGEEEFRNEAILVARLQHRNLVRFLGYCLKQEEKLLIYELLPNRSLDYFLFVPNKRMHLDWQTRYKIIGGIARGLLYLHEDSRLVVVHRDLKAGNILLDAEMNPKISDFGMARLFGVDQTRGDASKICGTYGYMPPEYVQQGHFSIKSDVYSFGVLLLEIITGLRMTGFYNAETGENLLSFAWRNWLEGSPLSIVDSTMSSVSTPEVLRCIHIGLLCIQENIAHRPIMSSIVLMLNSYTIAPPVPSRPAFLLQDNVESHQSNVAPPTTNEASISELDPR